MTFKPHHIIPALTLALTLLLTACSTVSPSLPAPTEAPSPSPSQTAAQTALPAEHAVWLLDFDTVWTPEKEQDFEKELALYYLSSQPLTFLSSTDADYVSKALELVQSQADSTPLYFSSHQESTMKELTEKGVIDTYFLLDTSGTPDQPSTALEEGFIPSLQQASDYFGPYFAMRLPDSKDSSRGESLPQTIFNSSYLIDLISAPDMTPYETSVDHRRFIYKGSTKDWTFEYETANTVTWYDMDGVIKTKGRNEGRFTAIYNGPLEDLNNLSELTISYKAPTHSGSSTMSPPFQTTEFTRTTSGKEALLPDGTEEIQAEVIMDGIPQTTILHSESPQT